MRTPQHVKHRMVLATVLLGAASFAWAQEQPISVQWNGTDIQGQAVQVPAAGKATILLFVRLDQPQSLKAIELVRAAAKDPKSVQTIAVVSGEQADLESNVKKVNGDGKWTGALVSDPKYALSGKLTVRVWPTTVVINSAGTQVAHIGGFPASFAKDLQAYVDFATSKIDSATLEKQLAGETVVADSSDQKAMRHVHVAQGLLEQGMADQALAELVKARDLQPADTTVQKMMVRVYLTLGKNKEAADLVGQITETAVSPAEMNTLRGRVALQQGKWEEAGKLLLEGTRLNPEPSEAYYYLGLVYQHQQDGTKAAEAFRKAYESTPAGRLTVGK